MHLSTMEMVVIGGVVMLLVLGRRVGSFFREARNFGATIQDAANGKTTDE